MKTSLRNILLVCIVGIGAITSVAFVKPVQAGSSSPLSSSTTVTNYTLTYSAGAGGTLSGALLQTVSKGLNGTTVTAVPNSGYLFNKWSDGLTTASRTDTNVQGNINASAIFVSALASATPITNYTLTYAAGAGGTLSGATSQVVAKGLNGSAVTAVSNSGYSFSHWSDGVTTASRTDTNVQANISVSAIFVSSLASNNFNSGNVNTNLGIMYTLAYSAGPNGSLSGSTTQTVVSGSSGTTVTAIPFAGYSFVSWSDGVTAASRTDTNVSANKNVVAVFSLSTTASGGGGGGGSYGVGASTDVSAGAAPSAASMFGSGTCPASLTITERLKQGARDGEYLPYNQGTVTQVYVLQKQINRILAASYNQAAGPVDGRFGPKTKLGVQRLQLALKNILGADLGPKGADGVVGQFTRDAINNSCGTM